MEKYVSPHLLTPKFSISKFEWLVCFDLVLWPGATFKSAALSGTLLKSILHSQTLCNKSFDNAGRAL